MKMKLSPLAKNAARDSFPDRRTLILFMSFFILTMLLVGRLFVIQVRDHDTWEARAAEQRMKSLAEETERGDIYLRDGATHVYPIAINREYPLCFVEPRAIADPAFTARELSRLLGVEESVLLSKMADQYDPFEIVKKRLSDDEVAALRERDLAGVHLRQEKYRYYPGGSLSAHVVGFASLGRGGGAGGYGVEAAFEGWLRSNRAEVLKERDAAGRWIALSDAIGGEEEKGSSVVLTLDRTIQYETERILSAAREQYRADRATAIVMEAKTGRIRAMATVPNFDPNVYSQEKDYAIFVNPSVSMAYEPGSVLKPLTLALGIDSGKIAPETEFVDTGVVVAGGYELRNSEDKVYGKSTMTKVLEESINTGVIFVERQLGHRLFREGMKRFGLGARTGVRLPAELSGDISNLDDERIEVQFYTASFGQGITATPLQIASAYAALGNGGTLIRPLIVEKYLHADGSAEEVEPEEVRQVVSRETSEQVSQMLESVVVRGHGKKAALPGYRVAGKTGTAQVAKQTEGGYEEDKTIGTFAGFAPLPDPRYVIVVVIENPKDVLWAESSAAPVFREILGALINYEHIAPDQEK